MRQQKTFRLLTPPPHHTAYKGSGGEVVGRAIHVRSHVRQSRDLDDCPLRHRKIVLKELNSEEFALGGEEIAEELVGKFQNFSNGADVGLRA